MNVGDVNPICCKGRTKCFEPLRIQLLTLWFVMDYKVIQEQVGLELANALSNVHNILELEFSGIHMNDCWCHLFPIFLKDSRRRLSFGSLLVIDHDAVVEAIVRTARDVSFGWYFNFAKNIFGRQKVLF